MPKGMVVLEDALQGFYRYDVWFQKIRVSDRQKIDYGPENLALKAVR